MAKSPQKHYKVWKVKAVPCIYLPIDNFNPPHIDPTKVIDSELIIATCKITGGNVNLAFKLFNLLTLWSANMVKPRWAGNINGL